ncbi:MAG: zinc metallopeptidase [Planctomycetaceae bacterium]|jgi:Zn-dependent membrane protease YugP|nr:MAG: zinc metallopeptidase [Planctomycetaceae bacterium]
MGYLWFIIPPFLLSLYAQWRVKSAFSSMSQVPTSITGAEAARRMLDASGLHSVPIELVPGELSDHYDPRSKVVRLSSSVYNDRSMAAVGVACHEVGHALQDANGYAPLVIRNLAVPAASLGSGAGIYLLMFGVLFSMPGLLWAGIALFSAVVFFQLINLPVEFNASSRAKQQLVALGMVSDNDVYYVSRVLNAAALTYVAATLQAVMTLLFYLLQAMARRD